MPTRRLFAYWLMILLPSLAIGGLALHYIRHEKDLLAAQQRASLSDQGRRAAEDILLLVENLQYGLVLSLENLPDAERATALRKLHRSDALVRQVFLFNDREQRVVLPDANEMERPEVQAFIRRYDALFTGRIPWFPGTAPGLQGGQPADTGWFARQAAPVAEPAAEAISAPAPAPAPTAPLPEPVITASQVPAMPSAPNAPAPAELGQNVIVVQLDDNAVSGGEASGLAAENLTSSKKVDLANSAKGALFRQIWNEYSPNVNRQQQRVAEPEAQIAQQPSALPPEETPVPPASIAALAPAIAPASLAPGSAPRHGHPQDKPVPTEGAAAETSSQVTSYASSPETRLGGGSAPMPLKPAKPEPALAKTMASKAEPAYQVAAATDAVPTTPALPIAGQDGTTRLEITNANEDGDALHRFALVDGGAPPPAGGGLGSKVFAYQDVPRDAKAREGEADRRGMAAARPAPAKVRARIEEDQPAPSVARETPPAVESAPAIAAKPAEGSELTAETRGGGAPVLLGRTSDDTLAVDQPRTEALDRLEITGAPVGADSDKAMGERRVVNQPESPKSAGAKREDDFVTAAASSEGRIEERLKRMEEREASVRDEIAVPVTRPQPLPGLRSGWRPWYWENAFHLLGFVQDTARGETFGVELELLALLSRLPAALDGGSTAAFVLRDQQGGTYFQSRLVEARETPVDVFNLGPSLAFYELAVFPADPRGAAGLARTSFLAMALLVGAFLVSIASGGGLLIAQARASWREAMQKTSFVSNVSHELKTPLTTLRMYTEMLRGGKLSEDKRARYLDVMLSEGERLSRLVGNVLDFSRLEQGRKKYQMEPLDLGDFTARVVEASRVVFERPELCLTLVPASGPVPVRADPDALEQVLLNLLDNAAKYGGSGGEIRVAVSRRGGRAFVDVLDRGPGVPAEHRARIFDKFHRVDESLTAEQGGCGLGLSIARRLARDHGGDITCEERPGGGAAFRLQLPAAEEARA